MAPLMMAKLISNGQKKRARAGDARAYQPLALLPPNIDWDGTGKGHWYSFYQDAEGRRHRRKVTRPETGLSSLHRAQEEASGEGRNTFNWLTRKYHDSAQFQALSPATRASYENSTKTITGLPTRSGRPLGIEPLPKWSNKVVQKAIDRIAVECGPASAKHVKQYPCRVFNWGMNRGYSEKNRTRGYRASCRTQAERYTQSWGH